MVVIRFDSWCRNRHAVTSVARQRAPILDSVSDVYFNMVVKVYYSAGLTN